MRRFFSLAIYALILLGCKEPVPSETETNALTEMVDLQNEIKQLELDIALKDSAINEALTFFNEIQTNLEDIGVREDQIRVLSKDPEVVQNHDHKEWILEQIRYINFLREDNARKVLQLNDEVKKNGLKIKELESMIESLISDIQLRDEQIRVLENELEQLDQDYASLFSAYQEQTFEIKLLTENLNTVYYVYGTEKELKENGVIQKKNGFIGIGKKITLNEELKEDYFTKADAREVKEIVVHGKNVQFITSHPLNSYTLMQDKEKAILTIKDVSEFWKISNYLVLTVK